MNKYMSYSQAGEIYSGGKTLPLGHTPRWFFGGRIEDRMPNSLLKAHILFMPSMRLRRLVSRILHIFHSVFSFVGLVFQNMSLL